MASIELYWVDTILGVRAQSFLDRCGWWDVSLLGRCCGNDRAGRRGESFVLFSLGHFFSYSLCNFCRFFLFHCMAFRKYSSHSFCVSQAAGLEGI
ncbi:hypothetical protein I7I50_08628 [Histoplasma capsulatum G186AR]|uniref:Uncharacterized protein n=1 Tax=Ajellomyces capsulatus TaxID=5037 RepID=A0A8H8CZD2_AJECA|nr:hypothetical protein I7I52_06143 [Histoplasma capsulatum]QSS73741.1 hypothetical protein I7I50_08628 [Histoplasma capsulatum G186AR]